MLEIFKALGDENRLRILNVLSLYELCVCELEVILDLSQSNVSRHLAKLKNAELISGDKDAHWIHYRISDKFRTEHSLLFKYLTKRFENINRFTEDAKRCERYKQSSYSCQTITSDRLLVMNYLKQASK